MKTDVFDVLSDDALLEKVRELKRRERRITFNVVMHLGEVERRRIYLRPGYGSMFDYCTRGLGYSESAAYRRIKTYRCIRNFPQTAEMIRKGVLSITTAAMAAGVMNRGNSAAVLKAVAGKSQRDVLRVVAGYRTGKPFRDRIKPVVVERPPTPLSLVTPAPGGSAQGRDGFREAGGSHLSQANKARPTVSAAPATGDTTVPSAGTEAPAPRDGDHSRGGRSPEPESETYYEFTIAADETFMQMYRRVRSIQSVRANPGGDIAATFKTLMAEYITRHAPAEKGKRRTKHKETMQPDPKSPTRYIPVSIRREVLERDGHQCTYVGSDGVRCQATQFLQFDHIEPFAKGGKTTPNNLRLLCSAHNQLEARDKFGRAAPGTVRDPGGEYGFSSGRESACSPS